MISQHLMTTPVYILAAGVKTDRYGQPSEDWSPEAVRRTLVYGFRWDNVSREIIDGRDALIEDSQVMLPPDAEITGRNRVEIDGQQFSVFGAPLHRKTPDGPHHIEIRINSVSG